MTQDKIKRVHRFYSWWLAAILVVIGVLMILSCLDIYSGGPRSYSAEAIALRFQRIAIPIYIGIVGIVGNIILNLFFPLSPQRTKSLITPRETMLRMRQKVSIPPIKKEVHLRLALKITTAVLFIALMVFPAIYFFLPERFTIENANRDVTLATIITIIPTFFSLALCLYCQHLLNASYRREIAIYKQALIDGQRAEKTDDRKTNSRFNPRWVQISLVAIAIIFVIIGIINGGAEDVLTKAIAICTECIGLG